MKNIILLLLFTFVLTSSIFSSQRKALVEVFTNSHCSICPGAHTSLKNYVQTNSNAENVRFIYYHMVYPYSDDPLNQHNTVDPATRNNYYGPFTATPRAFFDGTIQANNYSSWASSIDARVATSSPLEIVLSGNKNGNEMTINTSITRTGNISATDLVLQCVVVENVTYVGRNGVSPQIYVMRKMIPSASGTSFTIAANETKNISNTIPLNNVWNRDSLSVVVFAQSVSTKEVFQSEWIKYSALSVTGVSEDNNSPNTFLLTQNYPNPFNPKTSFEFRVPIFGLVSLKIFDVLGNEIATLVNKELSAGKYSVQWNAEKFPSGIYFSRLHANNFTETKKILLQK